MAGTTPRGDDEYVIGVDVGTEGVRVGVFDLAGTPLAFASEP
jgi:ribulose kinase